MSDLQTPNNLTPPVPPMRPEAPSEPAVVAAPMPGPEMVPPVPGMQPAMPGVQMPENDNPFALPEVPGPGLPMDGVEGGMANSNVAPLEDSFGKPIARGDLAVKNSGSPEPVFENGILGGNPPPRLASEELPPLAEKKKAKKASAGGGRGLPLPVVIIIYVVMACLIGVAVYFLWRYQYDQNQELRQTLVARDAQLKTVNEALVKTQDQVKLSAEVPVYVAPDGGFSFFQEIPGMTVNVDSNKVVKVTYGQGENNAPTDGFLMTISELPTNGLGLSRIVDDAIAKQVAGQTNKDKREEILADNVGFSYVENDGKRDKVIYLLQKNMNDANYMRIEYTISAKSDTEYGNYEGIALDLIASVKIY